MIYTTQNMDGLIFRIQTIMNALNGLSLDIYILLIIIQEELESLTKTFTNFKKRSALALVILVMKTSKTRHFDLLLIG